jgi:hypothetical protein
VSAPVDRFPDGPFPDGYAPIGKPIEEGGFLLYALEPTRDDVPHEFIIRAYDINQALVASPGSRMLGEAHVPLLHDNCWGIDVEDIAELEEATEELLNNLGGGVK